MKTVVLQSRYKFGDGFRLIEGLATENCYAVVISTPIEDFGNY